MTMRSDCDDSLREFVHPFKMAASSLGSPVLNTLDDMPSMNSVLESLAQHLSILDFSPFDTLRGKTSTQGHRSQMSTAGSSQTHTVERNKFNSSNNSTDEDASHGDPVDAPKKEPAVFSLRRQRPTGFSQTGPHTARENGFRAAKFDASEVQRDHSRFDLFSTKQSPCSRQVAPGNVMELIDELAGGLLNQTRAYPETHRRPVQVRQRLPRVGTLTEGASRSGDASIGVSTDENNPLEAMVDQLLTAGHPYAYDAIVELSNQHGAAKVEG